MADGPRRGRLHVWLSYAAGVGKTYTVLATTNLMTGFTHLMPTNIPATPEVNVYTDNVGNAAQKFYRVQVE